MGLVKEKHQLGLFQIANLRQRLEQLAQQPQHEGRVKQRGMVQPNAMQYIYILPPLAVGLYPVAYIYTRFTEESFRAFILETQEGSLYSAYGLLGDIAVVIQKLLGVLRYIAHHCPKILIVYEQPALIISHAEYYIHYAALNIRQAQQPRKQRGAHLAYGSAHRVASLSENIPEPYGVACEYEFIAAYSHGIQALCYVLIPDALLYTAAQIALYIRQKYRNAHIRE